MNVGVFSEVSIYMSFYAHTQSAILSTHEVNLTLSAYHKYPQSTGVLCTYKTHMNPHIASTYDCYIQF